MANAPPLRDKLFSRTKRGSGPCKHFPIYKQGPRDSLATRDAFWVPLLKGHHGLYNTAEADTQLGGIFFFRVTWRGFEKLPLDTGTNSSHTYCCMKNMNKKKKGTTHTLMQTSETSLTGTDVLSKKCPFLIPAKRCIILPLTRTCIFKDWFAKPLSYLPGTNKITKQLPNVKKTQF